MRLGKAAVEQGQMAAARAAWQAAGHWAELLPLCALQADLVALRSLTAQARPSQRVRLRRLCCQAWLALGAAAAAGHPQPSVDSQLPPQARSLHGRPSVVGRAGWADPVCSPCLVRCTAPTAGR